MTLKARYEAIVGWFLENRPHVQSELDFADSFQLLVAVVLSAQCTDKRVNMVTPELFRRFPSPAQLAAATPEEVYTYIKSVSYPNSKAEHLVGLAKGLVERFGGEVPSDIDSLMSLPGVGRKTANVVASIVYNQPVIAVDTHVFRVARRLGLSKGRTPEAVEKDLERHIAAEHRPTAHHWLILHGRYVCTARSPKCEECPLREWCKDSPDK
ncbi:MAG: endonuclease III [Bacteroidales bacterium]|nr:endonuclease III [Bacteroidales bacterium]